MANENQELKDIVRAIHKDLKEVKTDVKGLKTRQDEMYHILRGLEEAKDISKAEMDKLKVDMAKLEGHKHNVTLDTTPPTKKEA